MNMIINMFFNVKKTAIIVPYALYQAYGDRRVQEENYETMVRWMEYIRDRAENHRPEEYASWDEEHQARSRRLWNTDFHFGDWLLPRIVLGNSDAMAMRTALGMRIYLSNESSVILLLNSCQNNKRNDESCNQNGQTRIYNCILFPE